jgi:hypothetical protein
MALPSNRVEIVLMADQADPLHLWVEAPASLARRREFDKAKSMRVVGGAAGLFLLALFLIPAATALLSLLALMIVFPLALVGMAGFSRGKSGAP